MSARFYCLLFLLMVGLHQPSPAQPAAWQQTKLDTVATIEFPGPATQQEVQGHQVHLCRQGPTICMVIQQALSSSDATAAASKDQFYDGVVKGMLEETNGKLLSKNGFQVAGFPGVEVQFTTPGKPELPSTKFSRAVVVNSTLYILNYWTNAPQDNASATERNRFFTSFRVSAQPAAVENGAYTLGKLMGHLTFYALLLGGIILLVRRLMKSKKSAS
ncbi:MAG: hypothetical protein ACRYFX_03840 [Janthinobacterium lividum]